MPRRIVAICAASIALAHTAPAQRLTTAELTPFLDSAFADIRARFRVPGATVVVIHRGTVIAERAYGYSNVATRQPMSVDQSRFPVGSLSKTLTCVAVMRAVSQGRLRLSDSLLAKIPELRLDRDGAEITLEHLLTHTAGFETRDIGLAAVSAEAALPYETFLDRSLPRRVARPGREFIYSQEGMALAALMLERATGIPFEEYARDSVLRPLGMTNSSIHQRGFDSPDLVGTYVPEGDSLIVLPVIYPHLTPAGGLVTTTRDLATLAAAMLGHAAPVLMPDVITNMLRPRFRADSALPAAAIGFYEYRSNDRSGRAHMGWAGGASSFLYLLPEEDFAIVFAANAGNGDEWRDRLLEELHDRWFPRKDAALPLPRSVATGVRPELYRGLYRNRTFARSGLERLGNVFFAELARVDPDTDGVLVLRRSSGTLRAVGVSQTRFRVDWRGDNDFVAFDAPTNGPANRLFINLDTYDRIPQWQSRPAILYLLGGLVGLLPLALLAVVAVAVVGPPGTRAASIALLVALGSLSAAVAGIGGLIAQDVVEVFGVGVPPLIKWLAWLTVIAGGIWLVFVALEVRAFGRRRRWGRLTVIGAGILTLLVLTAFLFLGILSRTSLTSPVGPSEIHLPRVAYP